MSIHIKEHKNKNGSAMRQHRNAARQHISWLISNERHFKCLNSEEFKMTYSQYRAKFKSVERFEKAFGKLTEDEVHELLKDERCANFIKACVMSTWHKAKDKYGQPPQDVTDKE